MAGPDYQPVEDWVAENLDLFAEQSERTDPELGRILTIGIDGSDEQTADYRKRWGVDKIHVTGTIEFLCDHGWVIHHYQIDKSFLDENGVETASSDYVFRSEFDPESGSLKSSTINETGSGGYMREFKTDYRPLTADEVSECQKLCYLSGFGLPEPPGVKWGRPKWIYVVMGAGLFGLAWVGYRRFFRSN